MKSNVSRNFYLQLHEDQCLRKLSFASAQRSRLQNTLGIGPGGFCDLDPLGVPGRASQDGLPQPHHAHHQELALARPRPALDGDVDAARVLRHSTSPSASLDAVADAVRALQRLAAVAPVGVGVSEHRRRLLEELRGPDGDGGRGEVGVVLNALDASSSHEVARAVEAEYLVLRTGPALWGGGRALSLEKRKMCLSL